MITRRDIFQAIADPTRRAILALIAFQAMTPNAIAGHFDTRRQSISKHIKVLIECQLVKPEQTGREIHYHLNAKKMKEIDQWLEPFRQLWDSRFNRLETVLKNLKSKQHGK
jgi:DNA-binding transcriptional ArsR family regulator